MSIRLWPQDFERKDHISKGEKSLLRNAARNFKDGHIAVSIDPVGMSTATVKMGMYISPEDGLITFSLFEGEINVANTDAYRIYVDMVESKIYERLLDSKLLIVRNGQYKTLKFPYKHTIIFADEKPGKLTASRAQLDRLYAYATYNFFQPITSQGKEKTIDELRIFDGIRKPYDMSFNKLTDLECRAIFERLAPEYTVIMTETEGVYVKETKSVTPQLNMIITGKELEYRTFFLDDYQVAQVNDMGTGHRVILANPGAGKSVLLLSKAFKNASIHKNSMVLLTCFNNNLADSYSFKRACANFGDNRNLFIMTFHKLVKTIYDVCLHKRTEGPVVTDEEIRKCISLIRAGKIDLKFKAIFIDEVQNFDPLYLELCYWMLEPSDDSTFLMAGDLNQSVRAQSKRGDVPWKRMKDIKLDFTGRVKYIEKNYRNTREIAEYLHGMLRLMNNRLDMLGLINSMEYEYNSFTMGEKPTTALNIKLGVNRSQIKEEVVTAIKEIVSKYNISYSDIAILFPFRKKSYLKYHFLYWLKVALDEADIPYSMIISSNDSVERVRYSDTKGVVISTIESSLGLDFKAVVLAGLYPYNYVFPTEKTTKEISSWNAIKEMSEVEQELVQSQMRAIYTACSRARDVLYVISDLKSGTPMEDILNRKLYKLGSAGATVTSRKSDTITSSITNRIEQDKDNCLEKVVDGSTIVATSLETKMETTFLIDTKKYPRQKPILGKVVGDTFKLQRTYQTYIIDKIILQ